MKDFPRSTDSDRPEPTLRFDLSTATGSLTLIFVFWTLAANTAVVAHLSFQTLSRIGPLAVVAGVIGGVFIAKAPIRPELQVRVFPRANWKWVATAVAIVALRGLSYPVFWGAAFLFSLVSAAKLREDSLPYR